MEAKTMPKVNIRWMIRTHIPFVLVIERAVFPYPWDEENFTSVLRQRNVIGMVAEHEGRVFGYMVYKIEKQEIEILSLAVNEAVMRQGVGTQLVDYLKRKLSLEGRHRILAQVHEPNLRAQQFFRAQGFHWKATLRNYDEPYTGDESYLLEFVLPEMDNPYAIHNRIRSVFTQGKQED